jgi:hypothetical protein
MGNRSQEENEIASRIEMEKDVWFLSPIELSEDSAQAR